MIMEAKQNGALVKVTFNRQTLTEEQETKLIEALKAYACKGIGSWFKYHTNVIVAKLMNVDYEAVLKMMEV